jgi:hypothetical protein
MSFNLETRQMVLEVEREIALRQVTRDARLGLTPPSAGVVVCRARGLEVVHPLLRPGRAYAVAQFRGSFGRTRSGGGRQRRGRRVRPLCGAAVCPSRAATVATRSGSPPTRAATAATVATIASTAAPAAATGGLGAHVVRQRRRLGHGGS